MNDDLRRLFEAAEPGEPDAPPAVRWARVAFERADPGHAAEHAGRGPIAADGLPAADGSLAGDGSSAIDGPASDAGSRASGGDPAAGGAVAHGVPPAVGWARAAHAATTPTGHAAGRAAFVARARRAGERPVGAALRPDTPSPNAGRPLAGPPETAAPARPARPRRPRSEQGVRAALLASAAGSALAAAAALWVLATSPGWPSGRAPDPGTRLARAPHPAATAAEDGARAGAPDPPADLAARPADERDGVADVDPPPDPNTAPPPDAAGSPTVHPRTDGVELDVGPVRLVILDAPDASAPSNRR